MDPLAYSDQLIQGMVWLRRSGWRSTVLASPQELPSTLAPGPSLRSRQTALSLQSTPRQAPMIICRAPPFRAALSLRSSEERRVGKESSSPCLAMHQNAYSDQWILALA